MKKLSIILITIAGLYSFTRSTFTEVGFDPPRVIDTVQEEHVEKHSYWLPIANYSFLYIGVPGDSITLSHMQMFFDRSSDAQERIYAYPDSGDLIVHIDTNQSVSNIGGTSKFVNGKPEFTRQCYKAFPVFFVNTTKDTLSIGTNLGPSSYLEAIDKNGKWRPVEKESWILCGTGLSYIFLAPGEIAVTSVPVYKGNFRTKLRLRHKQTLSIEFYGSINHTQFESEWDENDEQKPTPEE